MLCDKLRYLFQKRLLRVSFALILFFHFENYYRAFLDPSEAQVVLKGYLHERDFCHLGPTQYAVSRVVDFGLGMLLYFRNLPLKEGQKVHFFLSWIKGPIGTVEFHMVSWLILRSAEYPEPQELAIESSFVGLASMGEPVGHVIFGARA